MANKSLWAFKIGLFIVIVALFAFTIYQSGKSIFNFQTGVPFTDLPGSVGLGFRTVIGFLALVTVLFFLLKRDLSVTELLTTFRWIVLLEAVYWVLFLPAAMWGLQYSSAGADNTFWIIETGLPCLVESIALPSVLVVLFFKIGINKPTRDAIRWGLIVGVVYIFVFWFNYTAQWWSDIYLSGLDFFGKSHLYSFEFIITVGGLLLLGIYTAVYAKNNARAESSQEIDLRKAGLVLTAFGLYFDINWLLGTIYPSEGLLTVWPTFILSHNVDLWLMGLPLIGIPLLFFRKKASVH